MNPIRFTKMSGSGNDFIIIDNRVNKFNEMDLPDFVKKVCTRRLSVGADGIIIIEEDHEVDFKWRFFNADGSIAEMCGNGARCAARFAVNNGIAKEELRFRTIAGIINAWVKGEKVQIEIGVPNGTALDQTILIDDKKYPFHFVNTGVPHVVIFLDSISDIDLEKIGKAIRFHQIFQPEGTNVNFAQVIDRDSIKIRTYERGVEAETLACGTGASAVAFIANLKYGLKPPIKIVTKGGILEVDFSPGGKKPPIFLTGDARFIYTGELHPEALI